MVEVVQGDGSSCTIMLVGMTEAMEGKWASRLDTDLERREVELVMQRPPAKVEVVVGEGEVGEEVGSTSRVTCTVEGGTPRPTAVFTLQSNSSSVRQVNFTEVEVTAVEGGNATTFAASFVPQLEDLGASVGCTVTQTDLEGLVLLQETALAPLVLHYAPLPLPAAIVEAEVGSQATILVSFR